jgi:hypothetical protein
MNRIRGIRRYGMPHINLYKALYEGRTGVQIDGTDDSQTDIPPVRLPDRREWIGRSKYTPGTCLPDS